MSLHKDPKYQAPTLVAALQAHGMEHDKPSQLADAFRCGWVAAQDDKAAMAGWQPIETAPKNMEDIDIWSRFGRIPDCSWNQTTYGKKIGFVYQSDYDCNGPVFELVPEPTHWMPLPTGPLLLK